jgi:gliding motility-associated-like protein
MKRILLSLFLLFFIPLFSQYKNQSIGFKENKGQIIDQKGKPNNAVKYLLNSGGLNVQLRKNGFSYDVYEVKKTPILHSQTAKPLPYPIPEKDKETKPEYNLEYIFHRIDIDFVNSNPRVELITDQKSKDFDNYYNVPNKPEGIVGVHQYKQITYKNIYPNIDVVFTIPDDPKKTVEYNFVVHPKGKISDIQLKFSGAKTDLVDNKIQMNVRFGKMEETLPMSWTEDGESKKEITVGYKKIKKNVYGFESTENVSNKTVVIDPVPTRLWGTYYGGNGLENQWESLVKSHNGNVFIGGYTESTSNIATTGAFQTSFNFGNLDGFISKFDASGQRIWGTYYGGEGRDAFRALDIDLQGNIYAVGEALISSNLATQNSFQNINKGWYDGIIVKFDSNGQRIWGTYFGGSAIDFILDVKVDKNQDILICGYTSSFSGISTSGSFHPIKYNNQTNAEDGFLSKFSKDGNRIWSTYYEADVISVDVDSNNNIFISGDADRSTNDISTNGSYDETFTYNTNSGVSYYNSFFAKFSTDGNRIFGSYYGGIDRSINRCIKVDKEDNFLITGSTDSTYGLTMINSYQSLNAGGNDIYLAKFTNNGAIIWNTFYGGTNGEEGSDLDIDEDNNIYLLGNGDSQNNISSSNSYQNSLSGFWDLYIIKFSPQGKRIWSTYYGGDLGDTSGQISYEGNGIFYISGSTNSLNNISTSNAFQTNLNGAFDSFLVKFKDCLSSITVTSNSPICIGKTLELKASGGTDYLWTGPNGFTSTDQNPIITNASTLNSGEYSCTITGTGGCDDTKKIDVVVGDFVAPIPDLATLPTITGDCHTIISAIPTATDACAGAITGTTSNPLSYTLPGTYTIVWSYDDGNGNSKTQSQTVNINSQPLPTATSSQTFCVQKNATLDNIDITTGQNIKWYDELTTGTFLPNSTLLQDGQTYYASQTISGCESERVAVAIKINDTPAPTGNSTQPFCSDQNPTVADLITVEQNIKWYDDLTSGNILSSNTSLQNGLTYYASQTVNSCESNRLAVTVSIQNTPGIPTGDTNPKFCKSEKATINNITINGQNLKWYVSNTATTPLANTTLVQNNTTYYVSQTIGCESNRLAVLVNVSDTPLPAANTSQTFCIDENAAIANIMITGQNLIWYDAPTAGNIVPNTTPLENKTYYVTQTNANCESERLRIVIKIQDTQPPIGDANQSFCVQQNATINTIKINGEDIKWYTAITAGTNLSESTPLETGVTYYASQTINNCESERTPIAIQIFEATTSQCINFVDALPYPKFFTPNNDGFNETWTIDFIYLEPNSTIRIFDRYGKFIKELSANTSWDGNYLNQPLPSTDYWFLVKRLNGAEFKGHFSLKR